MSGWYYTMNLIRRFIFKLRANSLYLIIVLGFVPIILISILWYSTSHQVISERSKELALLQTKQLSNEIDTLFQTISKYTLIGQQENTVEFLTSSENTVEKGQKILEMIDSYHISNPVSGNILDISILSNDGKIISESRGIYSLESINSYIPNTDLLLHDPEAILIEQTTRNGFPALTMTTAINRDIDNEIIGFIKILIDASIINETINNHAFWERGSFYVINDLGQILFQTAETDSTIPTFDVNNVEQQSSSMIQSSVFYAWETSKLANWKIVGYENVSAMIDANKLNKSFILTMIIIIIATLALVLFIFYKVIRPIRVLGNKMKQVSLGNYNIRSNNKQGASEIAHLENTFNELVDNFQSSLQRSIKEEKQLKIAEFRVIQSQIKPHFLYNALDTIIWMAETKNSEKVIQITKALSQFFRSTLNKGKSLVSIESEIEHIRGYLIIQKIRYEDILEVIFHFNEDILEYKILKLTLQPLIENAIYHGIKNKRGKGFIHIKGDFDPQGNISIDIVDNGIGMGKEKLDEIKSRLSTGIPPKQGKGGFGMLNVHQRIRLFYGKPYGLTINSWEGSGTKVRLIIPSKR